MALLFCDSFNHYDTAHISEKYDGVNGASIVSGGRNPGYTPNNSLSLGSFNNYVSKTIPNSSTLIVGVALNPGSITQDFTVLQFADSDMGVQVQIKLNIAGQLQAIGNGNVIAATPNGSIFSSVYNYIEVAVTFSTTASGTVAINVNGVSQANVSGVVTAYSGNSYANRVQLYNSQFDDFYICDGTGTINNTFLGDIRVAMSLPTGNGRVNSWTRVGGTSSGNYTAVDDNPPDDDTSYVYSSTVAAIDSYQFASIGTPAALVGVQLVASVRKDDSGTRVVALGFGNSTTDVFNAGSSVPNEYTMIRSALNTNPITGNSWAPTDLASAQIAVKVIS